MPKKIDQKSKFQEYPIQTIISRVFDPPIVIMLLTIFAIVETFSSAQAYLIPTLYVPVFFGVPLILFFWEFKTHHVSNWDISNRKERIVPLIGLLGCLLLDIVIVAFIGNLFLFHLFLLYFLWVFGFLLITLFWKISGHTGITTLAALVLYQWLGPQTWFVFLAIPLVAWARISRKDHTWLQAIAGIVYSIGILYVYSFLFSTSLN